MDLLMIVLRALHVVLGVFWAGTLFFLALFLEPSIRAALPESAKVQQQLLQRRVLDIVLVVALLTIVTGLLLLWRVSGRFDAAWMGSRPGMAFSTGGLAAIVAFIIGVGVMRPAQLRAASLGPAAQQAEGAEREALMAHVQDLRRRVTATVRWVASLLALSVLAMGVARYL
jgi:uncharacterized membrane protein